MQAALPFTVITTDARRPLAAWQSGDQVMVALDDLAPLFQVTVREDALVGGVTVSYKGKTIIVTAGQALASVGGRLVSLPAAPVHDGRRWLVPVEFISRALGLVYDAKLDVRRNSRFVLVGDVRVPRIGVRADVLGPQTRVTFTVAPRTPYTVTQETGRVLVRFDADALDIAHAAGPAAGAAPVGPPRGSQRHHRDRRRPAVRLLQHVARAPGRGSAVAGGPDAGRRRTGAAVRRRAGGPGVAGAAAARRAAAAPGGRRLADHRPRPRPRRRRDGVEGRTGALEKDVSLAVARRLKAAIEARLGVRVLLTRDADTAVPLDERAALANNNKADVFVSLHVNASARPDTSGAQIYYLAADPAGEEARRVAASRQSLPALGGGFREIEMMPWELAQLRHLDRSALLAGALDEQLRGRVRMNARAVQQAPLRVLAGANMPAVLVEIGFLTNPDEERQLASDGHQATVAQALLDGILRFRELADQARTIPPPVPPAGSAEDAMSGSRVAAWTLGLALFAAVIVAAFIFLPRWYAESNQPAAEADAPPAPATPKIKARSSTCRRTAFGSSRSNARSRSARAHC